MDPTDHEIIARAKTGHEEAFRMLVERHSRAVYRLAYRLTSHAQDAEEVVQETFLRVFRNLGGFEERARFRTWLYRVASNAAMDQLRRRQRQGDRETPLETQEGVIAFPVSGPGPEHTAASGQVGDRIAAAMERLTPAERTAFTLRHLEGRSIQEIEEALGVRTNAAKNTVFRAVQKLRLELEPLMSELP